MCKNIQCQSPEGWEPPAPNVQASLYFAYSLAANLTSPQILSEIASGSDHSGLFEYQNFVRAIVFQPQALKLLTPLLFSHNEGA